MREVSICAYILYTGLWFEGRLRPTSAESVSERLRKTLNYYEREKANNFPSTCILTTLERSKNDTGGMLQTDTHTETPSVVKCTRDGFIFISANLQTLQPLGAGNGCGAFRRRRKESFECIGCDKPIVAIVVVRPDVHVVVVAVHTAVLILLQKWKRDGVGYS